MERYRSGHNEAVLKTVCPQGHMGSNPILSVRQLGRMKRIREDSFSSVRIADNSYNAFYCRAAYGEVPKLAEGTPLERVQVVNSGARVQIPPSPLSDESLKHLDK